MTCPARKQSPVLVPRKRWLRCTSCRTLKEIWCNYEEPWPSRCHRCNKDTLHVYDAEVDAQGGPNP
jgi:hypothetical protein